MVTEKSRPRQVGRKPKADPCRHRYAIYMNDAENVHFLSMCEDTGMEDKSRFIKSILFQKELKVVKIDKAAMDYYMRLTTFYAQFRAIGNNYNQVTRALKKGKTKIMPAFQKSKPGNF
jgi:hypothetical protein